MNSSTAGGPGPKKGFADHARLLAGAVACGALAVAVLPFDASILGACNLDSGTASIAIWDWLDRHAPRALQTVALIAGASILIAGVSTARRRRAGFALLVAFVVTVLVTGGLKSLVGRARPLADPASAGALWSPLDLKDDRSFPSGHVSVATSICAALWLAARRGPLRNAVWVVPPAMMYDRVCLAVHWPSDVLGAAAIGLAIAGGAAFVAGLDPVDRALSRFGRGGPALGRFLLAALVWLAVTRVWRELPLGRDPVSGAAVPGFETEPRNLRVWLEPFLGPPLHLGLEDMATLFLPAIAWSAAVLLVLAMVPGRTRARVLPLASGLLLAWVVVSWMGWAPPDRFRAEGRRGVFVDWHLHGDDPLDGGITENRLRRRQKDRGVRWAVMTHHSRIGGSREAQFGVAGAEWSGNVTDRASWNRKWTTPHVLLLGREGAFPPAGDDALADVRAAAGSGALAIVAHHWRSQATVPGHPSFDEFFSAGVHGFEIGNRRRETDPAALERLRDLDRRCREKGLLRFSFSDDHGIPAGSPCVTFLEGVDASDLGESGGLSVIERLRAPGAGGIDAIPLLFHPGDPTLVPPRWLAPPVVAFEYFRSLRTPQRASWFAFAALAALWIFRAGRRSYTQSELR